MPEMTASSRGPIRYWLLLPLLVVIGAPLWLWLMGGELLRRLRYAAEVRVVRATANPATRWLPFMYGSYYDFPRTIVIEAGRTVLALECAFSEELDDYPLTFEVYRLARSPGWPSRRWKGLTSGAVHIGRLETRDVTFDSSRRHSLYAPKLAEYLT